MFQENEEIMAINCQVICEKKFCWKEQTFIHYIM